MTQTLVKPKKIISVQPQKLAQSPVQLQEQATAREEVFYQGIGVLYGKVSATTEGDLVRFSIKLTDGSEWGAIAPGITRRALARELQDGGKQLYMKVYPQSKLNEELVYFNIRGFQATPYNDLHSNEFVLAGCWQFVPQSRRPVISIHRNPKKDRDEKGVSKSSHIPLLWRNESSPQPFRFKKESEERPQFYRVKARFIPRRGTFGFMELLQGPLPAPKRERKNLKPETTQRGLNFSTVHND